MNDALVDANFLIALAYPSDRHHQKAYRFISNSLAYRLRLPTVILPEVMYMLRELGGYKAVIKLGEILADNDLPLVEMNFSDFQRAIEIMSQYQSAELDFADACITAMAERLKINHICTFDERDFRIIVPAHAEYFTLLPKDVGEE